MILYVYNTYFLSCFIDANLPRNLLIFTVRMRKEKLYDYIFFGKFGIWNLEFGILIRNN